jgi:hypothetical protein
MVSSRRGFFVYYKRSTFIVAVVLIIVALTVGSKLAIEAPQNLGPQLTYAGREDYSCFIYCDNPPDGTYYFTTDLSPLEMWQLLQAHNVTAVLPKDATVNEHDFFTSVSNATDPYHDVFFRFPNGRELELAYYRNHADSYTDKTIANYIEPSKNNKTAILSVSIKDYLALREVIGVHQ